MNDTDARDTEREEVDVRHMDIGETRTVKETQTYQLWAPDVYFGTDRDVGEIEVADIEVVEPELEGDYPDIEVTWQADVTKQLGRRWDEHDQPVTDAERKRQRRKKRLRRWSPLAITGVIFAVTTVISTRVMNATVGQITINGEAMTAPTTVEMLPLVLLVFGLAALIMYGLQGGFPGYVGGHR